MKIQRVKVQNYKSIQDSGWVDFDDVVALVGPNEAGKTAFLEALRKLNPVDGSGNYDVTQEYPRRNLSQYREREDSDPDKVVKIEFKLTDLEIQQIESEWGQGLISDPVIRISKDYQNTRFWRIQTDETVFVDTLKSKFTLPPQTDSSLDDVETLEELVDAVRNSDASSEEFPEFREEVLRIYENGISVEIAENHLLPKLPEFLYFDDYYTMAGNICIEELIAKDPSEISKDEETFLSFLSLADFDIHDLQELEDFEDLIAELEAVSSRITDQVFEYWTQGPDLRVIIRDETEVDEQGRERTYLHARIFNDRHQLTLPFGERSRGFIWFFSFLAYFSDIETSEDRELILLLDEPGLNLHAKAQYDLLRFINEELAPDYNVVYTTHSPFMLEPRNLNRARLVEDVRTEDEVIGTKISDNILESGKDTLFPLQAALGYDLIQTLLIGPECLLVEGGSDMRYIQVVSEYLEDRGRESLSHSWTIVPVGGADNVPTFVSLFGSSGLDIGILLDSDDDITQRYDQIMEREIVPREHIKTVGQYIQRDEGDIEDLLGEDFYTQLAENAYYRAISFDADVDEIDLDMMDYDHPRLVKRVERFFQRHVQTIEFSHDRVAEHLQKNRNEYRDSIPDEVLDRFEELFEDLNEIIE